MTYRDFPAELVPNENSMTLIQPSLSFQSKFNGVQQDIYRPGGRWQLTMSFNRLQGQRSRVLSAFLNGMQGRVEPVKVIDHTRKGAPPMGDPAVSGDGQTGRSLLTMGWLANSLVLSVGDYITVNDEMKEISEDAWSDDTGIATLKFNPPLRKSPANSAKIETENPYFVATLDSEGVTRSNTPGVFSDFDELVFIEAIYK